MTANNSSQTPVPSFSIKILNKIEGMTYVPKGRMIFNLSDKRTVVSVVCKQVTTQFAPTVYENMSRFAEDTTSSGNHICYASSQKKCNSHEEILRHKDK